MTTTRLRETAKNKGHFDTIVEKLRVAESKSELSKIMLLFAFDMSYDRGDVLSAAKAVKLEKGWAN